MVINIFFFIVIIACTVGIFFCLKADKKDRSKKDPKVKTKAKPKAGALAVVLLLIITASTIVILVRAANPDDSEEQNLSEELFCSRASGYVLGRHLGRTFAGYKALIITHDRNSENALLDACMDGLREGLGTNVNIAAVDSPLPSLSKEKAPDGEKSRLSPERMLYLSRKMQSNNFDQLIAKHSDCNLIISLLGLPKDANKMAILNIKPEKRPKLALLSYNISMMKERIAQGDISAAVINRPDYVPGKSKLPKNFELAFDKRYLLVTPNNVKNIASEYPSVFSK